jgi:hypothetical protein
MNRKIRRERWWQFAEKCEALYDRISALDRVIVQPFTSKYVCPSTVSAKQVFSAPMVVFTTDSPALFAVLQSALHSVWVTQYGSKMGATLRYTPSDCFETFALPVLQDKLAQLGALYEQTRRSTQRARKEGLTNIYNRFHDSHERSLDIRELRRLQVEMDQSVAAAYDWSDLDLDHGFHETKQGLRYTISETARYKVLDRLLALNHQRHAEEEAEKITFATSVKLTTKRSRKPKNDGGNAVSDLFDQGEAKYEER